jgi:hypothetical protein
MKRSPKSTKLNKRRGANLFQLMRNPNQTIMIRLTGWNNLVSDAGGVVSYSIPTNPDVTGLNNTEYVNYWSNLYTMIRVRAFRIHIRPLDYTITQGGGVAIASNISSVPLPGSYDNVLDNADGQMIQLIRSTSFPLGYCHQVKFSRPLNFSEAGSAIDPGPFAGVPGGIIVYSDSNLPGLNYYSFNYEGIYELTNRV